MRRIIILAVIGIVANGATGLSAQKPSATQKAVFALEEEWTRALVKTDTMAFKRLTVPEFVYTEDNVVMTQKELIHAVVTGDKVD